MHTENTKFRDKHAMMLLYAHVPHSRYNVQGMEFKAANSSSHSW